MDAIDKLLNDPELYTENETETAEEASPAAVEALLGDVETSPDDQTSEAEISILDRPQQTPGKVPLEKRVGLFASLAKKARQIDEEVAAKAAEVDQDDDEFDDEWKDAIARNKRGSVASSQYNINLIITHDERTKGVLAFNEFTSQPCQVRKLKTNILGTRDVDLKDEVNGDQLQDVHSDVFRAMLSAPEAAGGYDATVSSSDIQAGMRELARQNSFHPIRRYLEALEWDGVSRVGGIFTKYCGAEDNEYHREVAQKFILAAVTRIYEPGYKFDYVPILESGKQGIGKSTFVRELSNGFFAELIGDDMTDTQKAREKMQGAWVLEVPELTAMKGRDAGRLKTFISAQTDKARMAYDRFATEIPRQAVFIGTVDRSEYLEDPAGNRRYWPVKCGNQSIDIKALKADVDQIWAEALHIYKELRVSNPNGNLALYLEDPKSRAFARQIQKAKMVTTPEEGWKEDIAQLCSHVAPFDGHTFCDKMHEIVKMDDGSEGMRIRYFSAKFAWCALGNEPDGWKDTRTQARFTAAIAHINGIDKGSTSKKTLPSYCSDDGIPGDDKAQRYYVVDHTVIQPIEEEFE